MGDPTPFAVRGELILGRTTAPGAVIVEGGRIAAVHREPRDGELPAAVYESDYVAPGLIDLQVNGGFGAEIGDDSAALRQVMARLPAHGVTAFLPTIITSPPAFYPPSFAALAAARGGPGAIPLGLHLEGPFLSPARKGAHRLAVIEAATAEWFTSLPDDGTVRLVTLAPERSGALAAIGRLRARGIVVSLGHTDATYDEFVAGIDAGATKATHLFNAMSPFVHRAPGAIGATLDDDRVIAGLIADGIHADPASVRLAIRAKGSDRIALVSDMMAAAGMPPGRYAIGGQAVEVDGETARLADGTLAGSILPLDGAVRNVVRWIGLAPAEVLRMATEVPADLIGATGKGRLVAGGDADLVLLDRTLAVEATFAGGRLVFQRHKEPPA